MGKEDRERAGNLRFVTDHHAAIPQRAIARTSLLRRRFRRVENDEGPGSPLSVLLCRRRPGEIAWCARNRCSGRQKIPARNAGCDPRTVESRSESKLIDGYNYFTAGVAFFEISHRVFGFAQLVGAVDDRLDL